MLQATTVLAQCTGSGACELPTGLPWYFGVAIAAVWLTVVAGAVLLVRRRILRRNGSRRRRDDRDRDRDRDRAAVTTTDVERW